MSVMIATVARNEDCYIGEWIAFHLLQGVDHFIIFDNDSDDGTGQVARMFAPQHDVRVIPWPTPEGAYFIPVQSEAYKSALTVAQGLGIDWLMFTDIDEFTFGDGGATLAERLKDVPEDIGAIAVKPYDFGSNFRRDKPSKGLVIENFRRSVFDGFAASRGYVKTIGRPHAISGMRDTPHSVQLVDGFRYVFPNGSPVQHSEDRHGLVENPALGGIVQHHYITKSWEEFVTRKRARYAGKTRKIDDEFFWSREKACNAQERPTLVGLAGKVRAKMVEAGLTVA